ncbi:MAG: ABC transporter ATP-binding protein [Planctomycetota bacterium]|nr:ABC transporter ATP-binding protein [Planctomycetota bacterium]
MSSPVGKRATPPAEAPEPASEGPIPAVTPHVPVISARGVRKSFQVGDRSLEILHGIDLDLLPGELVALVGTSGAGKSTLLHILGLLEKPTEGQVNILARDAWERSTAERARLRNREIGFVFQFYHLLPELTALENALLPAMIAESRFGYRARRKEYEDRARELLDRFDMTSRLKHRPNQLSGGERQRVAMARAMLHNPRILLADEPTGNLDSATGAKVLELLFEEQRRREFTMILVTHDERIAALCRRTLYLGDGTIQADSNVPVPD